MPQDDCSSIYQEYLDSQRELGYSYQEAAGHFEDDVAAATQQLWEDVIS